MPEQYRTKGKEQFSSLNAHACQHSNTTFGKKKILGFASA